MSKKKKIIGQKYYDQIGEYVETHKRDAFTKLLLGILIILLVFGYMRISKNMQMTMEVPATLRESGKISIGYDSANDLFFKVWGEYFVDEYTSLSPQNVTTKLNHLLSMTESQKAVVYKELLDKKAMYIKKNRISTKYTPNKEIVLPKKQGNLHIFHSEGLLQERIGNVKINYHCEYNVGLMVRKYRLLVGLLNEKCKKIGEIK
jgi:hypothetical protein